MKLFHATFVFVKFFAKQWSVVWCLSESSWKNLKVGDVKVFLGHALLPSPAAYLSHTAVVVIVVVNMNSTRLPPPTLYRGAILVLFLRRKWPWYIDHVTRQKLRGLDAGTAPLMLCVPVETKVVIEKFWQNIPTKVILLKPTLTSRSDWTFRLEFDAILLWPFLLSDFYSTFHSFLYKKKIFLCT